MRMPPTLYIVRPSTLNPQTSTLKRRPSTLDPAPPSEESHDPYQSRPDHHERARLRRPVDELLLRCADRARPRDEVEPVVVRVRLQRELNLRAIDPVAR